ncbi:transmembrane protein 179B-like [Pomacea canaliculata]|uniref:transmembrane protein 179B-like n=1 Tax=Pomacea canaliculata TaxID=400727 RepID=UPI000D73B21D|nr:transmembrane protein 179B-like [Pomacea canaliculata]
MAFLLDFHLLAQTVVYFTSIVCGLAISIPIGVTKTSFDKQCLLYTEFQWKNSTFFLAKFGDAGSCNFIIFASVFVGIFYPLGLGIQYVYALTRKNPNIGSQMWVLPFILSNCVAAVLFFIGACIISVGLKSLCDSYLKRPEPYFESCADADKSRWYNNDGLLVTRGSFYSYLHAAEVASWVMVFVWAIQVGLGVFRLYKNRRQHSADSAQVTSEGKEGNLKAIAADV